MLARFSKPTFDFQLQACLFDDFPHVNLKVYLVTHKQRLHASNKYILLSIRQISWAGELLKGLQEGVRCALPVGRCV